MGLFSKKEDVPEIPKAPSLPDLPAVVSADKKDLPDLPAFPSIPKNDTLNQEMVKSAVSDSEVAVEVPVAALVETPALPSRPFAEPEVASAPSSIDSLPAVASRPAAQSAEPIFVRIDKFQAAQKSFENIKSKVSDIESVLEKMKEVKIREEQELKGWTEDVEKIKLKLGEIDSDIFSQI